MPRFADSKEIVANEIVLPIDEQYQEHLKEIGTLSSPVERHLDMVEKQGQHL